MRPRCAALVILAAIGSAAWASSLDARWIHIRVDDRTDRDSHVDLQLPLSMISTMMPVLRGHMRSDEGIRVAGKGVDIAELRQCWVALKGAKDGEYVTVRDGDDDVRVSKRDGLILVQVDERGHGGAKVRVKVPVDLVESLLQDGEIEADRLARSLASLPAGELVSVDDDDSHVRIWIDEQPAAPREQSR